MAQRIQVNLVDDLNGEEAQETVRFGIDGTNYEIDLTTENAETLRSALSEYVEKGRKAKTGPRAPRQSSQGGQSSSSAPSKSKREETQRIRQWAQDNGHNPSSRGRITQSIIDAYNQAH